MAPLLLLVSTFLLATLLLVLLATKLSKPPAVRGKTSSSTGRHSQLPLPPGPRGVPVFGNLFQLGTKPHHTLHALSRVYGPLLHLRLGSTHVVVASNAATAAACLKTHDANFSSRPPNAGATYIAYDRQDLVWAPYGPRWRMLRRICTLHLFSPKALEDFRGIRQQEVGRLVARLAAANEDDGQAFQVGNWLTMCAANVLTRAMLGRRLFVSEVDRTKGCTGEAGARGSHDEDLRMAKEFKDMALELMQLAGEFVVGDFLPALSWLDPKRVVSKMKDLNRRLDCFLSSILQEHKKRSSSDDRKDMLSVLIGLQKSADGDQEAKLNDTEIKALLLDLFSAGTDTTSSTLEWALAELLRHPDLLRQAQQELDAVVGRGRLVCESDLGDLPLLNAIVKETFRLHPSTPLSLPHLASEDCEVGGYLVPAGATLLVNVWAISRDPAAWPDPLEFRPARFLPGGKAENVDVRGTHFEIIPFGAGRRICAGMNWGLRMVHLMAATLIHAFHWELPSDQKPGDINMEEAYGLTLQRSAPLLVRPTPRLDPAAYVTDAI